MIDPQYALYIAADIVRDIANDSPDWREDAEEGLALIAGASPSSEIAKSANKTAKMLISDPSQPPMLLAATLTVLMVELTNALIDTDRHKELSVDVNGCYCSVCSNRRNAN